MKLYITLLIFLFFLCGCTQPISNTKENIEKALFLESLFFYNSTEELENKFGASNLETKFIEACETCGPEGSPLEESYYTTQLFSGSNKEVFIDWNSDKTCITHISVQSEGNIWQTKEGFKIGDSISKIQNFVKTPFELMFYYGFSFEFNNFCRIYFNDNIDFYPSEAEVLQSNDSRLKKIIVTQIEMSLPGNSKNF